MDRSLLITWMIAQNLILMRNVRFQIRSKQWVVDSRGSESKTYSISRLVIILRVFSSSSFFLFVHFSYAIFQLHCVTKCGECNEPIAKTLLFKTNEVPSKCFQLGIEFVSSFKLESLLKSLWKLTSSLLSIHSTLPVENFKYLFKNESVVVVAALRSSSTRYRFLSNQLLAYTREVNNRLCVFDWIRTVFGR